MVKELRSRLPVDVIHHQWIAFHTEESGKIQWAEPEGWIELKDRVILFECKLTGGPHGRLQMEALYKPLLEHLLKKPVFCLLICRHLTPMTPGPFFTGPVEFALSQEPFGTWHWLPEH